MTNNEAKVRETYALLDHFTDLLAQRRRTPWWRPLRRIWLDTQINATWIRLSVPMNEAMRDLTGRGL
jgi:hypothetical protein